MHYILNKDGTDLATQISADLQTYSDDISVGGTIGTTISYKLKAVNSAGDSPYTQDLVVTVGQVPNPPQNLRITSQLSQTEVDVEWDPETAIVGNLVTLGYKVYLDDLSGNEP